MSLTNPWGLDQSAIKKAIKECAPLKSDYYSIDGTPCFLPKETCLVPYSFDEKTEAAICGSAFDYAARFLIAQNICCDKKMATSNLLAERYVANKVRWINCENEKNKIKIEYQKIIDIIEDFITGKDIIDEKFLNCCIALGKMDLLMRGGSKEKANPFVTQNSDKLIITELQELLSVFLIKFIPVVTATSDVVFNPHFGVGSRIIGGADADVFIDGTLYDFKTSKNNGYRSSDSTQIIGYYILNSIAKDFNDTKSSLNNKQINKVALYKARFGKIAFFDTSYLSDALLCKTKEDIAYHYILYNIFHIFCSVEFSKTNSVLCNSFISKLNFSGDDFYDISFFFDCYGTTYQRNCIKEQENNAQLQATIKKIERLENILSSEKVYELFLSLLE